MSKMPLIIERITDLIKEIEDTHKKIEKYRSLAYENFNKNESFREEINEAINDAICLMCAITTMVRMEEAFKNMAQLYYPMVKITTSDWGEDDYVVKSLKFLKENRKSWNLK